MKTSSSEDKALSVNDFLENYRRFGSGKRALRKISWLPLYVNPELGELFGYIISDGKLHYKNLGHPEERVYAEGDSLIYETENLRVGLDKKTYKAGEILFYSGKNNQNNLHHGVQMGIMFNELMDFYPFH